ncbi:hypothetical protein DASB73_021900 [Starmerella bacillaris]|uniref:Uncharacterized protein n=1 Tax=Starmerella bacillaris TaxID=1247836 RepID=A0AAV5RJQ4_STABA|nr:hypothetical protein DASB73_021900 [Starmerella bacillaris]
MDTDSSSDFEFPEELIVNHPKNVSTDLQQQLWEKAGENEILRSQLDKARENHQQSLNDVLAQQQKIKEEYEIKLRNLEAAVDKERLKNQFSAAELKVSKIGSSIGFGASGGYASNKNGLNERSRKAGDTFNELNDGFVIKKHKPSNSLTAEHQDNDALEISQDYDGLNAEMVFDAGMDMVSNEYNVTKILSFLVAHRCPGFDENTLKQLYSIRANDVSIGQVLSNSSSATCFLQRLAENLEAQSDTAECCVPMVSLMYEFSMEFFMVPKVTPATSDCRRVVVSALINCVLKWLREMDLFIKFKDMDKLYLLKMPNVWRLTAVLYALNTLSTFQWEFTLPVELVQRILSHVTQVPLVFQAAFDLLSSHPCTNSSSDSALQNGSELINILSFQLPSVFDLTPALLFSGLTSTQMVTAAELQKHLRHSPRECRLARTDDEIDRIKEYCIKKRKANVSDMQASAIRLARFLAQTATDQQLPHIDRLVLGLLIDNIDDYIFQTNDEVVVKAVAYFWSRNYANLKMTLSINGNDLTELCICLSKLIFEPITVNTTVEQARQLLQVFSNSEEIDSILAALTCV